MNHMLQANEPNRSTEHIATPMGVCRYPECPLRNDRVPEGIAPVGGGNELPPPQHAPAREQENSGADDDMIAWWGS
jgi:hypothetical protein